MNNQNIEAYKNGSFYEIFMLRAFRASDNSKPGMHSSAIENLVRVENGDDSWVKYHGSYEKQFAQLQKYMHKALDKYLLMKQLPESSIKILKTFKHEIDRADSSNDLMRIIHNTLELTQEIK